MSHSPRTILFSFGTRPEAIKLVPLILAMKDDPEQWNVKVCITSQHKEMLWQVLDFFKVVPDADLDLMQKNQSLVTLSGRMLLSFEEVLDEFKPELVVVQGDTSSAFLCALAAFYKSIRVAHIEAGLRSYDRFSPFPEEVNRRSIAGLADFHFAPTEKAVANLKSEGITEQVYNVGNTVIDALIQCLKNIEEAGEEQYYDQFSELDTAGKNILITIHRRESFGEPLIDILDAIEILLEQYPEYRFFWPVHLNPNIRKPVLERLEAKSNIILSDPLPYDQLIWLMSKSFIVLTDSGGIQEEAPHLGIPVVVVRDKTERTEAIEAGTVDLCGRKKDDILKAVKSLLEDQEHYDEMARAINPYGDGKSSIYTIDVLKQRM